MLNKYLTCSDIYRFIYHMYDNILIDFILLYAKYIMLFFHVNLQFLN